jgi:hypothetical protein
MAYGFRTSTDLYILGAAGTRRHSTIKHLGVDNPGWTQPSHCLFVTPMPPQNFGGKDARLIPIYVGADGRHADLAYLPNGDAVPPPAGYNYGALQLRNRTSGAYIDYFPAFLEPKHKLIPMEFSLSTFERREIMHRGHAVAEIFKTRQELANALRAAGLTHPDKGGVPGETLRAGLELPHSGAKQVVALRA